MNGLNLEVIWFDQDTVEILVSTSNRRFSGTCTIYAAYEGLAELADALRGFPSSVDDRRVLELGTFSLDHDVGWLRVQFHWVDSSGHSVADIKLRGDACNALGEIESVALRMRVEASGIDSFVRQLERVDPTFGASAFRPLAT